jgi:hypothetical protein
MPKWTEEEHRFKKQFELDTKDTKYFSLLPPGAKPPVDLNKAIMDKYGRRCASSI